jgi:outer membrane protein TolC
MLSKSGSYTREQYDNLQALARAARRLADQLEALMSDVDAGALTLSELERAEAEIPRLSDSIQTIESEFPEIPH